LLSIGYNCVIDSNIRVPGTIAIDSRQPELPDIRIRLLDAEAATCPPPPLYRLDDTMLIFTAPGIASYRCRPDEIEVMPLNGARLEDVIDLLIATALPALLWMRGGFVLHASAVVLPGDSGAIAIAGPSGIGKSTLAAELLGIGAALVGDDTLDVRFSEEGPAISGLPGGYFQSHIGSERRSFRCAKKVVRRSRLRCIAFLAPASREPELRRLSGLGAADQILLNRHRPKIPDILRQQANLLLTSAALANTIPAFMWRRPGNAPRLGQAEFKMLIDSIPVPSGI
jgi:hypothetical protein